ncbi:MAG TPA: hypothetical protein VK463_01980 [Desulfomonilaceae bacterium]|nr:hypothetical protein [Desulfomonilaceae bacterium]
MYKLSMILAALVIATMVAPALSHADYYVIRDSYGQPAVTSGLPGYGWVIDQGPFATMDQAQRATGIGMGRLNVYQNNYPPNFPSVVPSKPGAASAELSP